MTDLLRPNETRGTEHEAVESNRPPTITLRMILKAVIDDAIPDRHSSGRISQALHKAWLALACRAAFILATLRWTAWMEKILRQAVKEQERKARMYEDLAAILEPAVLRAEAAERRHRIRHRGRHGRRKSRKR